MKIDQENSDTHRRWMLALNNTVLHSTGIFNSDRAFACPHFLSVGTRPRLVSLGWPIRGLYGRLDSAHVELN
jgi:hypothetical protein